MSGLLAILGSPRKGGNTDILLGQVIKTARQRKATARYMRLDKLDIRPCRGCERCVKTGVCVISDDMGLVYSEIEKADAIVIGSPVYFGNISGQLKIMIDRMQPFWARKYILKIPQKPRKKGAFILCGAGDTAKYSLCSEKIIRIFFTVINAEFVDSLYVSNTENKRDILKQKGALKRAGEMVLKLI